MRTPRKICLSGFRSAKFSFSSTLFSGMACTVNHLVTCSVSLAPALLPLPSCEREIGAPIWKAAKRHTQNHTVFPIALVICFYFAAVCVLLLNCTIDSHANLDIDSCVFLPSTLRSTMNPTPADLLRMPHAR